MGGRGGGGGGRSGMVTIYHRTRNEATARAIAREGFKPTFAPGTNPEYVQHNKQYAFFSTKLKGQRGYGNHVVAVSVPKNVVKHDPYSGQVRVKVADLPKPGGKTRYRVFQNH
jgi:hypothetical protein